MNPLYEARFQIRDYNLDVTLSSGQAFRWRKRDQGWEGVIGTRWIRLRAEGDVLHAWAAAPVENWAWLEDYLQLQVDLRSILATFPTDPHLQSAVQAWHGLRLLRQDPWECLASFICSSTKQIVQIQQIVHLLCERWGAPVSAPAGSELAHAFPSPSSIAEASEADLRACKLGFRAAYLHGTARRIAEGAFSPDKLRGWDHAEARERLLELPGVGPKIADCVLLFAGGFPKAFPVDVWVFRALRELYFPRRRPSPDRLRRFIGSYFGPHAGYAQQYLFHSIRMRGRLPAA